MRVLDSPEKKNLIESTTHVWKLNINKMGVAPCMHIFFMEQVLFEDSNRPPTRLINLPRFSCIHYLFASAKKKNHLDLAALPRKSVANYETIFNF